MILRIMGVALLALICTVLLRNTLPGLAPFIAFSAGICILIFCFNDIKEVFGYFYDICNRNKYGEYFKAMLKGLGVAYLATVGADLCRDCGEAQLAGRIELAAKAEILIIAFPLVKGVIELSESILVR